MIAMALASNPKLLLADEPTTALDVSLRGQILDLLSDLQRQHGMAVLLITHDLNLVSRFADRVAVMEQGHLVEQGGVRSVFEAPAHPYTQRLLASRPRRDVVEVAAADDPARCVERDRLAGELPGELARLSWLVQKRGVCGGQGRQPAHCAWANTGGGGRVGLGQVHAWRWPRWACCRMKARCRWVAPIGARPKRQARAVHCANAFRWFSKIRFLRCRPA